VDGRLNQKEKANYFQVSLYIKHLAVSIFLDFDSAVCYYLYMMRNNERELMTFTTLETRIEKAIAENVDPFTTDADIRFFETFDIKEELKTFMNDLWGSEGNFIDTPLGRGRIESVRAKAGIDLEVMVAINDVDGFTLFSGIELAAEHGIRS